MKTIAPVLMAFVAAGVLLAVQEPGVKAQTPQCPSPGVGQLVNNLVEVESLISDGFIGPASNTLYQPTGETLSVHVDSATNWVGDVRTLSDVRVGMPLQVVGRRQDDCSLIAVTILGPQDRATPTSVSVANATATPSLPPTGQGRGTTTIPWEWMAAGGAMIGLFLAAAAVYRLRQNR